MKQYEYAYRDDFGMLCAGCLEAESPSSAKEALQTKAIKKYNLWEKGTLSEEIPSEPEPIEEPSRYNSHFKTDKKIHFYKQRKFPIVRLPLFIVGLVLFYFMKSWWMALGILFLGIAVITQPFTRITCEVITKTKQIFINKYNLSFAYRRKQVNAENAEKIVLKQRTVLRDDAAGKYCFVYVKIDGQLEQIECCSSEESALSFATKVAEGIGILLENQLV